MRPAVLLLAPLLLSPLACTDTPVEPETEETTALFKLVKPPMEPGVYITASISCKKALRGHVLFWPAGAGPVDYGAACVDGPRPLQPYPFLGAVPIDISFVAEKEGDLVCSVELRNVEVQDLPKRFNCPSVDALVEAVVDTFRVLSK